MAAVSNFAHEFLRTNFDGSFRWQRLDNLPTEGAKSTAFDEAQLWLLLDHLVSDQATPLRGLVSWWV